MKLQVSKELYGSLTEAGQQEVLTTLFDVCVDSTSLHVTNAVRRVLKHVSLLLASVAFELEGMASPSAMIKLNSF